MAIVLRAFHHSHFSSLRRRPRQHVPLLHCSQPASPLHLRHALFIKISGPRHMYFRTNESAHMLGTLRYKSTAPIQSIVLLCPLRCFSFICTARRSSYLLNELSFSPDSGYNVTLQRCASASLLQSYIAPVLHYIIARMLHCDSATATRATTLHSYIATT